MVPQFMSAQDRSNVHEFKKEIIYHCPTNLFQQ